MAGTDLRNVFVLDSEVPDCQVQASTEESVLHCPAEHGDHQGDDVLDVLAAT